MPGHVRGVCRAIPASRPSWTPPPCRRGGTPGAACRAERGTRGGGRRSRRPSHGQRRLSMPPTRWDDPVKGGDQHLPGGQRDLAPAERADMWPEVGDGLSGDGPEAGGTAILHGEHAVAVEERRVHPGDRRAAHGRTRIKPLRPARHDHRDRRRNGAGKGRMNGKDGSAAASTHGASRCRSAGSSARAMASAPARRVWSGSVNQSPGW
jgi:hypothetical protein